MKTLLLAAVLAVSTSAAWAQSETTGTETEAEAEAPAASPDAGLSLGTVEGEAAIGETYVREEFSQWQLRCVRSQGDRDPCQLYQLLRDQNDNPVAEFNIFPLPAGRPAAAGANIITPLETLLTANLRMAVDGGQPKVYPFSFCSNIGCFSRIGLTEEEVGAFRAGNAALITIVPAAAPNETVELSLSLSGFTAGFNALVAASEAPAVSE
ncbi:MAG: invasion associated locus B family protein [Pseudomonadota bacterium]